jgi:probable rRNA maturation factor
MSTSIAVANQQKRARISAPRLRRLAAWLMSQATHRDPSLAGTALSIALVDDAGITPINKRFVRHSGPTDVISFRYAPLPGAPGGSAELVINVERAVQASRQRGGSASRELGLYLAHGCLHLAGEDDATPAQRARMQRIQNRWLRQAEESGLLASVCSEKSGHG